MATPVVDELVRIAILRRECLRSRGIKFPAFVISPAQISLHIALSCPVPASGAKLAIVTDNAGRDAVDAEYRALRVALKRRRIGGEFDVMRIVAKRDVGPA